MKGGRLNLRFDQALQADAREYAKRHGTSLTQLIEQYLRQLLAEEYMEVKQRFDTEQVDA